MITILRTDVSETEEAAKGTAMIGELLHMEMALDSLESKLEGLKEFLLRVDRKRGLIKAGGEILKMLFGTATITDLDELHTTVDALHRKEDSVVHSLNQQATYLKELNGIVRFNCQLDRWAGSQKHN